MGRARSALLAVWASRAILVAYGVLMVSGFWSQLSDLTTTMRLVGSDVGCSLSLVDCNWVNFTIDKIVAVAVIGSAGIAQFAAKWRYRDRTQMSAAVIAIVHLIALQVLSNPS